VPGSNRKTGAGWSSRTGLPPSPDRCSRTSSALDGRAASPSADTPGPAFTLGVVRFDQSNQPLPRHHLIHLDQEQFLAGLLALAGVLGVGKGHLLHRDTRRIKSGYSAKLRAPSSEFP